MNALMQAMTGRLIQKGREGNSGQLRIYSLTMLCLVLLCACETFDDTGNPLPDCPGGEVFTDVRAELTETCISCHNPGGLYPEYDLTDYNSTVTLVEPGNPEASRLYESVTTGTMSDKEGALEASQIIACWILNGAPEQ